MKFQTGSSEPVRMQLPLAPMIDVGFQLLIFFLLNLRMISPEGNFNLNMPISAPTTEIADRTLPEIKVSLRSDRDGKLTQLAIGSKSLGNDDAAFERLNQEILTMIGRPGNPLSKEIEIEIDADFETQYQYVIKAISKCTGRVDPDTRQMARYVEKIKFAPPHPPKS